MITSLLQNYWEVRQRWRSVAKFLAGAAETVNIRIQDMDGNTVAAGGFKETAEGEYSHKAVFTIMEPKLWNPETPYLYP